MYRKKLLYDEMVDTPLDRLLEIGYQDLRRNQEAFRVTAARIDAKRPAKERALVETAGNEIHSGTVEQFANAASQ